MSAFPILFLKQMKFDTKLIQFLAHDRQRKYLEKRNENDPIFSFSTSKYLSQFDKQFGYFHE